MRHAVAMPASPETVAMYLSDLAATHKAATLTRRVSAISQAHQLAGPESPTDSAVVRAVMAGIRRAKGTAPRTKAPALTDDVRGMVAAAAPGLLGVRDRALLLSGFAGAFRRSDLTSDEVHLLGGRSRIWRRCCAINCLFFATCGHGSTLRWRGRRRRALSVSSCRCPSCGRRQLDSSARSQSVETDKSGLWMPVTWIA
jgi:hypothetical protein